MPAMNVSAAGRSAIESREGKRLVAYRDSVGVLTIGVGHTGRMSPPAVTAGMRITLEQCDAFLAADLAPVEAAVNGLGVPLTQNQFDALASFAFNVGVPAFQGSNVVSCVKHGLFQQAADALMSWMRPAVLKTRREAERKQFLTPDATPVAARPTPSAATPIVANAITSSARADRGPSPAPSVTATDTTKGSTVNATTTHDTSHVNVLAGIGNIFGTVVSSIESAIKVAVSPTTPTVQAGQPAQVGGAQVGGAPLGAVFGSIQDAQAAVTELNEVIADAKAGRWTEEPTDVVNLLKTLLAILSRFGINVPVVSAIVQALPAMEPVATPA